MRTTCAVPECSLWLHTAHAVRGAVLLGMTLRGTPASLLPVPLKCGALLSQEFDRQVTAVLQSYHNKLTERTANHMGYPYNLDFDYGALAGLERFSINNLGDPFIESNYGVHSREFEVRCAGDLRMLP